MFKLKVNPHNRMLVGSNTQPIPNNFFKAISSLSVFSDGNVVGSNLNKW